MIQPRATTTSTAKEEEEDKDEHDGGNDERLLLDEKNNNINKKKTTADYESIDIHPKLDEDFSVFKTKPLSGEEKVERWGSRYFGWDTRKKRRNNYERFFYSLLLLILLTTLLAFIIFVYERMQRTTEANRILVRTLQTKLDFFKQKLQDAKLLGDNGREPVETDSYPRLTNDIEESLPFISTVRKH